MYVDRETYLGVYVSTPRVIFMRFWLCKRCVIRLVKRITYRCLTVLILYKGKFIASVEA